LREAPWPRSGEARTVTTSPPKPDFRTHFAEGVAHFNQREFWDAHESWETIWLVAESDVEQFLQGLIQIAAAYHHVKRGTYRGAIRLFEAGLRRLEAFPPEYCDLDRGAVEAAARAQRELLITRGEADGTYPELVLLSDTPAPPLVQW
jgi:predicted metal-dependent hydrolase